MGCGTAPIRLHVAHRSRGHGPGGLATTRHRRLPPGACVHRRQAQEHDLPPVHLVPLPCSSDSGSVGHSHFDVGYCRRPRVVLAE
eukprot:scaffold3449_cov339-Prasinococcus_capsulatus_cf.AAC.8